MNFGINVGIMLLINSVMYAYENTSDYDENGGGSIINTAS